MRKAGRSDFLRYVSELQPIDFRGEPVRELPRWISRETDIAKERIPNSQLACSAQAEGLRVQLYPPMPMEIAYQVDDWVLYAPYSEVVMDLSTCDEPLRVARFPAGSIFLAPPQGVVRVRTRKASEFLSVMIEPDRATKMLEIAAMGRSWQPSFLVGFRDPGAVALLLEIRRAFLNDVAVSQSYLSTVIDAIMVRLGGQMVDCSESDKAKECLSPGLLRKVTTFIEERLAYPVSVGELADVAGLSRSHFSRAFHAEIGEAPQDYIIGRRINRARDLLIETDESIAMIAAETGFCSHSHLSSTFKKWLGVSPAEYRASFKS